MGTAFHISYHCVFRMTAFLHIYFHTWMCLQHCYGLLCVICTIKPFKTNKQYRILTIYTKLRLCYHYTPRPVCMPLQSDQALLCWLLLNTAIYAARSVRNLSLVLNCCHRCGLLFFCSRHVNFSVYYFYLGHKIVLHE